MRRFFSLSVIIAPAFITLIAANVWIHSYRAVDLFYGGNRCAICSSYGELVFIFTDPPNPAA
jgi:hypothetical protein